MVAEVKYGYDIDFLGEVWHDVEDEGLDAPLFRNETEVEQA